MLKFYTLNLRDGLLLWSGDMDIPTLAWFCLKFSLMILILAPWMCYYSLITEGFYGTFLLRDQRHRIEWYFSPRKRGNEDTWC